MTTQAQTSANLFMVRPACFQANPHTLSSNAFQGNVTESSDVLRRRATEEFDAMVDALRACGVRPLIFTDTAEPEKPDAVFPNNWISTHADGTVILYPMETPSRRAERRADIVVSLSEQHGFAIRRVVDLTDLEHRGLFLEGTGSLVLDRVERLAYVGWSSRTHAAALAAFTAETGYAALSFHTADASGRPVYHTNVMMSIGSRYALICAEAIADAEVRVKVLRRLQDSGRALVEISLQQMSAFAGNLLEIDLGTEGPLIAMSNSAFAALSADQRGTLEGCGRLLPIPIETIETVGGGSVRCMIAEIFLPHGGGP